MTSTSLERLLKKESIDEEELKTLIKSSRAKIAKHTKLDISGNHVKFGYFSDSHIGHKEFKPELWDKMCRVFKQEGVEFIVNAGDNLEGMSGRPGHVYELTHIGLSQQLKYATDLFSQLPVDTYGIDGNHDGWYYKKNDGGAVVGELLERAVSKYHNLGQNEADIEITPSVKLKLFHGNDGSSYALSYKMQKLIESFTGGEKPQLVLSGHYHKHMTIWLRNVWGAEAGTLCGQSEFMRGKKLPAHMGFGLLDVYHNKQGIDRVAHEWFPYYIKENTKTG